MSDFEKELELDAEAEIQSGYHGKSLRLWLYRKKKSREAREKADAEYNRVKELNTPVREHNYIRDDLNMAMVCCNCGHKVTEFDRMTGKQAPACTSGIELDK